MSSKRKLSIVLAIAIIIGGCLVLFFLLGQSSSENTAPSTGSAAVDTSLIAPRPTINVDGINFELSTTTAQQEQGLSDRAVVPDNYAMLFVFPEDGQYGFWMREMEVPLDLVWVRDDDTIASITADVPADSYPTVFYPPEPIRYVLEVRAGFAAEKGWVEGTKIALPAPY